MPGSSSGSPNLSHDLKNHLGVILGFCELLLDHPSTADVRSDLLEIRQAAQAALALLEGEPADP